MHATTIPRIIHVAVADRTVDNAPPPGPDPLEPWELSRLTRKAVTSVLWCRGDQDLGSGEKVKYFLYGLTCKLSLEKVELGKRYRRIRSYFG